MPYLLYDSLAIGFLLMGDFAANLAGPEVTHLGAIHPAVVAVFQMLASLMALVGFSGRTGQ